VRDHGDVPVDVDDDHRVLVCERVRTRYGRATRVQVARRDLAPMGFRELYDVFDRAYPGRSALQLFPRRRHLMDQANLYHLYVLDEGVHAPELDLVD
jgi:hypothetical protein